MKNHGYLETLMTTRFRDLGLQFSYGTQTNVHVVFYFCDSVEYLRTLDLSPENQRVVLVSTAVDEAVVKALEIRASESMLPLASLGQAIQFLHQDAGASWLIEGGEVTAYGYWCCAQLILHFIGLHAEALEPQVVETEDGSVLQGLMWLPLKPPAGSKPHLDFLSKGLLVNGTPLLEGPIFDQSEKLRASILNRARNPITDEELWKLASPREAYPLTIVSGVER
jgi:hypothetical protein